MAEHPILFSGPLVRAILEGRKTVTRRPVTIPWRHGSRVPPHFFGGRHDIDDPECWGYAFDGPDHSGYMVLARGLDERHDHGRISLPCPFGQPGDRLWVRETWACLTGNGVRPVYRADGEPRQACEPHEFLGPIRWTPSIHMPRWASRLLLDVVDVRVERVQEITEADARAEGMDPRPGPSDPVDCGSGHGYFEPAPLAVGMFEEAWDGIYGAGPYAWDKNPWVWRIEFRKVEQ